ASCARIQAVDHQFDLLAIAVNGGGEELQKASETEQGMSQGRGRETDPRAPLVLFTVVANPQGNFRITNWHDRKSHTAGIANRRVRQIDANVACNRGGKHAIIRARVEQGVKQLLVSWPPKQHG